MSYFIIIGGSKSHIPFIDAARRLGYNTVVFDQNPNCPGADNSDTFFPVSTHDFNSLLQKCNELQKKKTIKGIITYSSDSEALMVTARLCQTFHLPSFSIESVELAVDKNRMKERFTSSGIPTPLCVKSPNIKEFGEILLDKPIQWILKPASGAQGSLGVSIVQSIEDYEKSFTEAAKWSKDGSVILEEYYCGREFSVDGVVINEAPIIFAVSEKFNLGSSYNFTMSGFATGTLSCEDEVLRKKLNEIINIALLAVKALKIDNSFFSADVILSEKGPILLECGILLDAKIDRLLNFAGVDVYTTMCKIASGENIHGLPPILQKGYALKFMFATKEGKLKVGHTDNAKTSFGNKISLIEWEKNNEDLVNPPKSIADTLGWVITEGYDQRVAYGLAKKISEGVNYEII